MAGAVGMSGIGGVGYIATRREPRVTVVVHVDRYHVCVRKRGETWKEAVAEFLTRAHAERFAAFLREEGEV